MAQALAFHPHGGQQALNYRGITFGMRTGTAKPIDPRKSEEQREHHKPHPSERQHGSKIILVDEIVVCNGTRP
ncbi:hypothetical protein CesoFtcFv8_023729 [Champsocephalus esox]|uniref:Uncharacterized protein n=1 Tax=Champsocephalus esox TaxID=159716 RepID=A0AAN8B4D5_9TELE|nr:hypothetical protein CesoFtcFv8_023729 [Champsocephalus esox]